MSILFAQNILQLNSNTQISPRLKDKPSGWNGQRQREREAHCANNVNMEKIRKEVAIFYSANNVTDDTVLEIHLNVWC